MPDQEKVLKGLECCIDPLKARCPECPYYPCYDEDTTSEKLLADALALLKAQQKTPVVFKQYDGSIESECGNCGLYLDKTYSVCPKCGKVLNWND